jgi:Secretion system C-terminal sorting domain
MKRNIFLSALLSFLGFTALRAQCDYTLILADDFGDGWNLGSLTITNGFSSEEFALFDGYADTVSFSVTQGQPLSFFWDEGLYDEEITFIVLNNIGDTVLFSMVPNPGLLLSIAEASCNTCLKPTGFKIDNIYDTRVKLSWTPSPDAISAAQEWLVIYGVKGFIPENKVGDTLTVLQAKATITGLQKKSEYDVYLVQNCQDGTQADRVGPLSFQTYWTNDVGISGLESPKGSCDLGVEVVSVRLSNFGSAPQSLIPFRYYVNGQDAGVQQPNDGFFTGVLGKDSTEIIPFEATFDFSDPGEYRIDVVSELVGDEDILNDTFTYYVNNVLPLPYTQGFETWDGGWTADQEDSQGSSWAYGKPNKAIISVAASGDNAWLTGGLDANYNNLEQSYLISPCFDFSALTEDPVFEFSVNYLTEVGVDGSWLEFSTDDGQSWGKVGSLGVGENWYNTNSPTLGDFWSGSSGGWLAARSILTSTAGKSNVRLRFVFKSNGVNSSEGFGVDDIRLDVANAKDLAANSIITEGELTSPCGKAQDRIRFRYSNFGTSALAADQVAYSINGAAPVFGTPTFPSAQPGESNTFTFPTTFDSRDNRFEIRCWVIAAGDQSAFNDTTTYVLDNRPLELPYFEDFEGGFDLPEGWETEEGFIAFDHGFNSQETRVLTANLYSEEPNFTFLGPRVGLFDASSSKLRFSYRMVDYDTELLPVLMPPGTKIDVQASKDCGTSFQNIYTINFTTHPLETSMQKVTVNLSGFNGEDMQIRFRGALGLAGSALDFWFDLDSVELVSCAGGFGLSANVLAPVTGQSNGQAALEIDGGTAPFTFIWSNGATTQSIDNLPLGALTVKVTDANGCEETLTVQVGSSGIGEIEGLTNVALFPNPARDLTTLQMSFERSYSAGITLQDLLGRSFYSMQTLESSFVNENIDTKGLPAGVYILRVEVGGQTLTRKFVKE